MFYARLYLFGSSPLQAATTHITFNTTRLLFTLSPRIIYRFIICEDHRIGPKAIKEHLLLQIWTFLYCSMYWRKAISCNAFITIKIQVFRDAFEKGKVNSLKRKPLHVSVVHHKHPLFWGQSLHSLNVWATFFVINNCHVESVALNNGKSFFLFLLLVLILWVTGIAYMREKTVRLFNCRSFWSSWKNSWSYFVSLGFYYKLTFILM